MLRPFTRRTEFDFRLVGLALALGVVLVACDRPAATMEAAAKATANATAKPAADASADQVARGEYLVTIAGCNDCHTPLVMGPKGPEPDMSRMLSGHPENEAVGSEMPAVPTSSGLWLWAPYNTAYRSPLGTAFAINLTPDENTGIGAWTEEIFVNTLRSGRHWGVARPILPPMPWMWYGRMTDEDLKAIFAYLRTIPPVHNRVPEAVLAPPPPAPAATGG